ncbi:MAG: response regulator transcription factor [Raoultibacter sp.]
MTIKVLIVDDDPFVCTSLTTILEGQPDIAVCAQGTSGPEAVSLFTRHKPDILLMDIQMPAGDGLSAAETLLATYPAARIVFLTTFSDDEYIVRALRLGAKGYLIKQEVANIAPALRLVMCGQSVLGGEVTAKMEGLVHPGEAHRTPGVLPASLSAREKTIMELVAEGRDNREISQEIFISEGTVRNHISAMLQKLGLKNRTQLAVYYYRGN